MKNRFFYFIFNVITPLVIGAVLYYIFSPTTLFVSGIDKQLRINCHIAINLDNVICQLMRFYLLDYLWAYALMNFALILFGDEKRITLSIFIYIIVMELLQIFPALHATFDVCDIGIEIIAGIVAISIFRRRFENEKDLSFGPCSNDAAIWNDVTWKRF